MNIDQEIQDLLCRNNCVIVPGFGAFICTNISSQLLEDHNFIPPSKQIIFNCNIINNDGLLVNYIAQYNSITYEEALKMVQNVVENWNNKLKLINKFYVKNVGYFFKNENGSILFESDNNQNYLISSFGLSAIVSPTIEKEIYIQSKKINESFNFVPSRSASNFKKERVSTFKISRLFRYAAIFLILLSFSSIVFLYTYNKNIEKKNELAEKNIQEKIERKISEANFILPILEYEKYSNTISFKKKYYVVAGSFSKKINAEKLKKDLEKSGYNSSIIARENNMFSVTYQHFPTEKEAETYRREIQKLINPDAWVLQETK